MAVDYLIYNLSSRGGPRPRPGDGGRAPIEPANHRRVLETEDTLSSILPRRVSTL